MTIFRTRLVPLSKAGQIYTGPKGGKWANPEHTVEYRDGGAQRQPGQQIAKRSKPRKRPKSVIHKLAAHLVFHAMKLVQHAMRGALDVARGAIEGATEAMKPDEGQGGQFDQDVAPDKGDGSPQAAPAVPQLPPDVAKTLDDETMQAASEQLGEMHASAPVEHKPAIEMTYRMLVQAHAEKQRAAKAAKLAAQHAAAGGDPFEAPGVGHPGAMHLPIPKKAAPKPGKPAQSATDAAKFKQAQQQRTQAQKQPKQAAQQKPVATKKPSAKQGKIDLSAGRRQPHKERVKTTPPGVPAGKKTAKHLQATPAKKTTRNAAARRPQAARVPQPKKATARSAPAAKRPPVAAKPAPVRKPSKGVQAAKPRTQRVSVRKSFVILSKARKLHKRIKFRGLDISVENDKGTTREWYDPFSKKHGETKMIYPYGYVRRTEGTDGDHVDVYVGPDEQADHVYVVTQLKAPDFLETDEQKALLGFSSAHDAQEAYLKHYDDPRFLGDIREIPFDDFASYVLDKDNHGELIRSGTNVRVMRLVKGYGPDVYTHGVNIDSQGSSAGERVIPQPVPDMRTWQQPKTAASKVQERDANRRRRRAFARWSRGALSLYGEPPDRKLRYKHQYLTAYKDRKAMLATRSPQIVADPISDDSR